MAVLMAAVELKLGLFPRWGIFGLMSGQPSVNLVATPRVPQQSAVSVMRPTSKPKKSRRWATDMAHGGFLRSLAAWKLAVEFDIARMIVTLTNVDVVITLNGRILQLWAMIGRMRIA